MQIINKTLPIVDSNVLIDIFCQYKYESKGRSSISKGCYINYQILTEVLNYVQNRFSSFLSLQTVKDIFSLRRQFILIPTSEKVANKAIGVMENYIDNKLSFTDCCILLQAEEYNLTVYTLDSKMQNYPNVNVINPYVIK